MIATSLITFAEFEQMPDTPGKQELIDGELIEMPHAEFRHTILSERIFDIFRSGSPGKRAHHEMGYRIGRGWLVPDVSVTRPKQEVNKYLIGSPELAVEVVSPSNRPSYIQRKLAHYLAEGAEEVWVIDPIKCKMSVYRTGPEGVVRTAVAERHESKFGDITLGTLFEVESAGKL